MILNPMPAFCLPAEARMLSLASRGSEAARSPHEDRSSAPVTGCVFPSDRDENPSTSVVGPELARFN
jgi:hypothetical protein